MGCANVKFCPSPEMSDVDTQVYDGELIYVKGLARQQSSEIFRLETEVCSLNAELEYFRSKYFKFEYTDHLMKNSRRSASTIV